MPSKRLISLVPPALLAAAGIGWMMSGPQSPQDAGVTDAPRGIELDPSRFLIEPLPGQGNQVGIGLAGGKIPVTGGQVPAMVIGTNVLRTVHLCWVYDWTDDTSRASLKALLELYASPEGASLPALKIHLNPVFSDPAGEAVHRAMLQVYFRSDHRGLHQEVAARIAAGSLEPDPEAIRLHVEGIEPLLMDDWSSRLEWLENDIDKTFDLAKAQQARNAEVLAPAFTSQLASMIEIVDPSTEATGLSKFILDASVAQSTWLHNRTAP